MAGFLVGMLGIGVALLLLYRRETSRTVNAMNMSRHIRPRG
jgi:hypothetical protein